MRCATWMGSLLALSLSACTKTGPAPAVPSTASTSQQIPAPLAPEQLLANEKQAADVAWARRDDESQLLSAIAHWQRATELAPKDAVLWEKLSRALYLLADGHVRFRQDEHAEEQMASTFEESVRAADRGLSALSEPFAQKLADGARVEEAAGLLDKTAVPLLYWRESALGKWAAAKGFATLLSNKDEIEQVMQVCIERDPEYFYRGPERYFGVIYAKAPSFAGGDLAQSRAYFDKALAAAPDYFATRVLMAEDLAVKAGDKALFEQQLGYVINGDPERLPDVAPENRVEQRKARALLAQESQLFE